MHTNPVLRRAALLMAGVLSVATLAACGTDNGDEKSEGATKAEATDQFPITMENAYGTTTIKEEPKRVATWGWGSTEAAISVGVYPVAVAEQVWTVGAGNLLPWVEEAYDEAGVEHPAVLSDAEGGATIVYDEFIAADPDLIVAPYSGLTEEQYKTLSDIAPVVAFPDAPWTTSWDDTITLTAQALGRSAGGEKVLAEIDESLAAAAADHPEFAGKTIAGLWPGESAISVYTGLDPRVGILTKLGFEVDPSVAKLDTSDGGFYFDMSFEKADEIAADVAVTYHDSQESADAMLTDKKFTAVPAIGAGRVAQVVGNVNVSAVSPPTALSFTWEQGMPALVEMLAAAVAK
ncbi:ABC transporter substrate-binding protein [Nocardioides dubius]|uniref:Iron-siderophore ABC transporter substrate-binding protein n=1 Tax=Nocardioides dubius TaxID=317019 RepID=A0ABN1U070_9ACTN